MGVTTVLERAHVAHAAHAAQVTEPTPTLQHLDADELETLERSLVRRIDRRLAILVPVFLFNHVDRSCLGAARLAGLERECARGLAARLISGSLGITTSAQWSWLIGVFFRAA